jgi:hypothetical protein
MAKPWPWPFSAAVAAESNTELANGERVGLADKVLGRHDEAPAASTWEVSAAAAEIITQPAKGESDPVEALLRLGQAAAADAERLERRIDPVKGRPERRWSKSKLQQARKVAADMVECLIAFLDHCAGDPDHEPTLAVPTSTHPSNQAAEWVYAFYANSVEEDEREIDADSQEPSTRSPPGKRLSRHLP